jgi:hypothetical protein
MRGVPISSDNGRGNSNRVYRLGAYARRTPPSVARCSRVFGPQGSGAVSAGLATSETMAAEQADLPIITPGVSLRGKCIEGVRKRHDRATPQVRRRLRPDSNALRPGVPLSCECPEVVNI